MAETSTSPNRPEVIAFLEAIKENPGDDTVRLILSDWLEEQDDPRGSFLRQETELASIPAFGEEYWKLRRQRHALWRKNGHEWLGPLTPFIGESGPYKPATTRGLLALTTHSSFLEHSKLIALAECEAWAWVEELRIGISPRALSRLLDSPLLSRLASLNLSRRALGTEGAEQLTQSTFLSNLSRLNLFGCGIAPSGLDALLSSEKISRLQSLNLASNTLTDDGVRSLCESRLQLRDLNLDWTSLTSESWRLLSRAPWLSSLESLSLASSTADSSSQAELFHSPNLSDLKHLRLSQCALGREGIRALTGAAFVNSLKSLDLSFTGMNAGSLWRLASVCWNRLNHLDLSHNELNRPLIDALDDAPNLTGQLTALTLTGHQLSSEAVARLSHCSFLSGIRSLRFSTTHLRLGSITQLLQSPQLQNLEELILDNLDYRHRERIGGMISGSGLQSLRRLKIMEGGISDTTASQLVRSKTLENLQELWVSDYWPLSQKAQEMLLERFVDVHWL